MKKGFKKGNVIIDNLDGTSTVVIPSCRHGTQYVLIDTIDAALAAQHTWCAAAVRGNKMYAATAVRRPDGTRTTLYLHAHLMGGSTHSMVVDHRNHVTLDCRRSNLRLVPNYVNVHNPQRIPRGYFQRGKKYYSTICVNGDVIRLGKYDTPEEAHAAYLAARIRYGVAL